MPETMQASEGISAGSASEGSQFFPDVDSSPSVETPAESQTPEGTDHDIPPSSQDMQTEQKQPETEINQVEELPEKYKGKNIQDIIKMHMEAEKAMHGKGQEYSELKAQIDQMQQAFVQQQQPLQQKTQSQEAEQPQYFHQYDVDTQRKVAEQFAQKYADNPLEAAFDFAVNQPYMIDKHLENSKALQKVMAQSFLQMQEFYNNHNAQFSNHVKQYAEKNPTFKELESDINNVIGEMKQKGILDSLQKAGVDPIEFAHTYMLGKRYPQEVSKIEAAMKAKIESELKNKKSGYQVAQGVESKTQGADVPDLFGLKDYRGEGSFFSV